MVSRFGSTATVGTLRSFTADDHEVGAGPQFVNSALSRDLSTAGVNA